IPSLGKSCAASRRSWPLCKAMQNFFRLLLPALLAVQFLSAAPPPKPLEIYTIDAEGGKSVLFVSPFSESMLFDAGWPSSRNREASTDRIVAALKAAGLKQIDYLVISHFDIDHLGDVPALAGRFPIRRIMDHGEQAVPSSEPRFRAYDELR